ncbi:MAG: hypothetical protein K9G76_07515 [Bacteroidales bacterium]|nr:hypothetical protein [Bacteroidales bacterium]MCF8406217.1 hypothetical protein [Bacteroidales bacterium]
MRKIWPYFLLLLFVFISCKKNESEGVILKPINFLTGTWVYTNIEDEVQIMHRSDSLLKSRYGFTMKADGRFIERKNSGWCGQGGNYIFEDYIGLWKQKDNNTFEISVGYCEGIVNYTICVDFLSLDSLRFTCDYAAIYP